LEKVLPNKLTLNSEKSIRHIISLHLSVFYSSSGRVVETTGSFPTLY